MYLKIVVDNQTHYIKCGSELNVMKGDAREVDHVRYNDRGAVFPILNELVDGVGVVSLFPSLPAEEAGDLSYRTIVTDGAVYLLDDAGRTVDVIQR